MLTTIDHQEAKAATGGEGVTRAVSGDDGQPMAARLTTEQVWSRAAKASFAVLGYVTPSGEPRSSGVVYKTIGGRLYVAVAPESWKAKHVAASGRVAGSGRAAGLCLRHRGRPRGRVPHVRTWGPAAEDARPGRRSGTRAGIASRAGTMTTPLGRPTIGAPDGGSVGTDQLELKARVDGILNRRPAVGLAVGVVRNGSLEFFHGHGLADIASNSPITEDTVFRIGSITKTFTAIAVMQRWEQGLVDLDAPANDYLRAYKLVPAKPGFRPATVRQLLTHTAGIPEVVHPADLLHPGWGPFDARPAVHSVRAGERLPSLAEYYRGGLRLVVEPGSAFAYSNHGFATLGQIVEDVSGISLERYLRVHIFEPLGMADSDLVRSEL